MLLWSPFHFFFLLISFRNLSPSAGWILSASPAPRSLNRLWSASTPPELDESTSSNTLLSRRGVLSASILFLATSSTPAHALVKGTAPPPDRPKPSSPRKCTNIEECQALAERETEESASNLPPAQNTPSGIRYRDIEVGSGSAEAKQGDLVAIYYQVLKLGKRSYDGLSGPGTVIFSRGYGYDDDEPAPSVKNFQTVLGDPQTIKALNEGVVGMKVGGTRRIRVLPADGWRKPGQACDGGPGGTGAGGDLKTDYIMVPTAQMVAQEACLDSTKLPYPKEFAQQRRMAQRFDQSMILEVQLVSIGKN